MVWRLFLLQTKHLTRRISQLALAGQDAKAAGLVITLCESQTVFRALFRVLTSVIHSPLSLPCARGAGQPRISPGNRSWVAGGKWAPEKDDLSVIRHHLINRPKLLKEVISEPNFVKMFGPPKKDGRGKGKRCSLWGGEDELKVAPKMPGVDKTHKEIDFLKLRSFFVSRA